MQTASLVSIPHTLLLRVLHLLEENDLRALALTHTHFLAGVRVVLLRRELSIVRGSTECAAWNQACTVRGDGWRVVRRNIRLVWPGWKEGPFDVTLPSHLQVLTLDGRGLARSTDSFRWICQHLHETTPHLRYLSIQGGHVDYALIQPPPSLMHLRVEGVGTDGWADFVERLPLPCQVDRIDREGGSIAGRIDKAE